MARHDEGTIDISGCVYSQSQALVFFSFIVPFLKDAIVKFLDETLETCHTRGLTPEEPYIKETAMLLDGHLIDPIYRYMAEIDQRIGDKGDPKSAGRRDVTDEITEMVKFLDYRKDEMIQGLNEQNEYGNKFPDSNGEAHNRKGGRISNFLWTWYEKTLKVIVGAVLERWWPK